MSRVGKTPIKLPSGIKIDIKDRSVHVEGPKGKLDHVLPEGVHATVKDGQLNVTLDSETSPALHGLTRTLLFNMVHGVSAGFVRELDIVGVGYRASVKGNVLSMTLGFSHPVDFQLPAGVTARVDANTHLVLSGADKITLGMVASKIRSFRPPEPYQGKGIKYMEEQIIRKQGKAAGAK